MQISSLGEVNQYTRTYSYTPIRMVETQKSDIALCPVTGNDSELGVSVMEENGPAVLYLCKYTHTT